MGNHILTSHQRTILEHAQDTQYITDWYYFTGGTALTYCYLHHRYSDDLDFFTHSTVNTSRIDAFLESIRKKVGLVNFRKKNISGLYAYDLVFSDQSTLKIDFNEYDFPAIEKGKYLGKLYVDSLYDMAVNKLYTIMSRSKARDFVDLYFCIQKEDCSLEQLFARVTDKFGVSFDEVTVARQLTMVHDVSDYPKMLISFDKDKMIEFFLSEAKKLEPRIFK